MSKRGSVWVKGRTGSVPEVSNPTLLDGCCHKKVTENKDVGELILWDFSCLGL